MVDRVLDTFGMYSRKVLESITHKEEPWLDAMKEYFKMVDEEYNIRTEDGLRNYIRNMI